MTIADNVHDVLTAIWEAALTVGRDPTTIRLVSVTKSVGLAEMEALLIAGQRHFGENRAQVLRDKAKRFKPDQVAWHFIGPLQKNKIKYVYPTAELVHSIDSVDLLEEFIVWAGKTGRRCPCLLEVHISGEETKQGFAPDEVLPVIERFRSVPELDIRGLMGMAPFVDDEGAIRRSFQLLAGLFRESAGLTGPGYTARELSMGMTDDFPIAIAEGATMVRIGRALFQKESAR